MKRWYHSWWAIGLLLVLGLSVLGSSIADALSSGSVGPRSVLGALLGIGGIGVALLLLRESRSPHSD